MERCILFSLWPNTRDHCPYKAVGKERPTGPSPNRPLRMDSLSASEMRYGWIVAEVVDISEPTPDPECVYNDICGALRMHRGGCCKMAAASGLTGSYFAYLIAFLPPCFTLSMLHNSQDIVPKKLISWDFSHFGMVYSSELRLLPKQHLVLHPFPSCATSPPLYY